MGGIGGPRFRALTGRPFDAARLRDGARGAARTSTRTGGRDVAGRRRADDRRRRRLRLLEPGGATRASRRPPHVAAWLERVRALPGFADDYVIYPDNARPGASRSIYDSMN